MLVNHDITIDLANPGSTPRVTIKEGDTYSRNIRITLLENGQPWKIPGMASAVIRYHCYDPNTQQEAKGAFDVLEDGLLAYLIADNVIEIMPANAVMALRGLVTMDVVLVMDDWALATFNFELYVSRPPCPGTETTAPLEDYYRISTLADINREFEKLRAAITALGGTVG